MHIIEQQMINSFYQSGKFLDKDSHIILKDIYRKIQPILNDFEFTKDINERILQTHLLLNIPQLPIEQIYKDIKKTSTFTNLESLPPCTENIEFIIGKIKNRVICIQENYNNFSTHINERKFQGGKIVFDYGKIFIKKDNFQEEIFFQEINPNNGFFIQSNLHYILNSRNDTYLHLGLTDKNGNILAYCAFSILDRDYPLQALPKNTKKESVLNMTRAFCINNAPSNLSSTLFHKSYNYIKKYHKEFEYIITYINQNLGYSGSSFKGSSYFPIGTSPLEYLYKDGLYINRKGIGSGDTITSNQLSTLPIILLARGLNSKKQNYIENMISVTHISKKNYQLG